MDMYKEQLDQAISQAIHDGFTAWQRCEFVKKRKAQAKTVCLYGTGNFYRDYVQHMETYDYVCDSNPEKWGKIFDGRTCLSPRQLSELKAPVVFVMLGDCNEVLDSLKKQGIESYFFGELYTNVYDEQYTSEWFEENRKEMLDALDLFEDEQSRQIYVNAICNRIAPEYSKKTFHGMEQRGEYFGTGILPIGEDECYVDIGAYDGDSIHAFMKAADGKFQQIYGFEPDPDNYTRLRQDEAIQSNNRIQILNQGISCEEKTAGIVSEGTGSHITESPGTVKLDSLDHTLKDKRVTFIKMDIEGAEQDGLEGAKHIISSQHPKLAVSVYHRLDDMWKIPGYIKKLCQDYKLYLRHHTAVAWDTDCYAYVDQGV